MVPRTKLEHELPSAGARGFFRRTLRLFLFGVLVSYCFTVFLHLGLLLTGAANTSPFTLGNNAFSGLAFYVGAAALMPLMGALTALIVGAAVVGLGALLPKLSDERRERWGLILVASVNGIVLALPASAASYGYFSAWLIIGGGAIIAAGLVFLAVKWPTIELWARRIAGITLAAALLAFLGIFYLALGQMDFPRPAGEAPGPNILIVLSDAHRADWAGVYGGPVPTPAMDRLAAAGVCYERCYSPCTWTLPSISSLFTGLEPAVHRVNWNTPLPPLPTIQHQLREYGYRTWALYCNDAVTNSSGHYRGFDSYVNYKYYTTANLGSYDMLGDLLHRASGSILYQQLVSGFSHLFTSLNLQYLKAVPNELAVQLAGELPATGGVLAYVHLFDPHCPYAPPERLIEDSDYRGLYENSSGILYAMKMNSRGINGVPDSEREQIRRLYRGEIRYEDEILGRMLDELEQSGALENTIIFYTADHGEAFWEHGCLGHGTSAHNEQCHVPLIAYWPGRLEGGLRRNDPVSVTDIYPTVLEGVIGDYHADATLAVPLWDEPNGERVVFTHGVETHAAVVDNEATLVLRLKREGDDGVLYLADDEAQLNEVGDEYPEIRSRLQQAWSDYLERCDEMLEFYNPYYSAGESGLSPAQIEQLRAIGYMQ